MLTLLKTKWTFLGLDAPAFTWVAALVIVLATFGFLLYFYWRVIRIDRLHRSTGERLKKIGIDNPRRPNDGLSLEALEAASQAFEESPALTRLWAQFTAGRVMRRGRSGEDRVWASASAETVFSEAALVDAEINVTFFAAVPGVVTGAGLLFTFLAILVALLDVKIEENQVKGLNLLIEGLSGKFVSSIAALGAATIYLLLEKPLQHRLVTSRRYLVAAIDDFFPVLSAAQVLVDLTQDISEQSTAFRSFNADLSQKLRSSFSESMGPTLQRMVQAIEDLNQVLLAAEAQKQKSITGSLEALLGRLESSLTGVLNQMGVKFQESLSGGAMAQFGKVLDSLSGTASLLEKMNVQSTATQEMLMEVIGLAKQSTSEQFEMGKSQLAELTTVLRSLMAQLNETADSSVSRMNATLTAVVHGLSQQVGELSEKMSNTIVDSAGLATGAANEVIQRADTWTTQSAEQLRELLATHRDQLDTVKHLRVALEGSLGGFNEALERYSRVSRSLEEVVANVSGAAAALSGTATSARATHEAMQKVAGITGAQLDQFASANKSQREVWAHIQTSMSQYQQLFARVEQEAGQLLTQIGQQLSQYVQTSQQGFDRMVQMSDEHFANATKRLGTSVNELDDVLQTLVEELPKRRN